MKEIKWKYANENHSTIINEKDGVVFITFPKLVKAGVIHGCSTRLGGISKGHLGSMNLSFTRGDDPDNVMENYRRISRAIGFSYEDLVLSAQIHETKIRLVTREDRGDGIKRPTMAGVDALVTSDKGVPMSTSYADCVPLIFYDSVKQIAAMAHAGWRGTVAKIGEKTVKYMQEKFDVDPSELIVAIGPSICRACYEVSEDVVLEFQKIFDQDKMNQIIDEKENGKYQLDLWKANELILIEAGIKKENMDITDLCTCCNQDYLFSHRASHGKRGNLNCFITL